MIRPGRIVKKYPDNRSLVEAVKSMYFDLTDLPPSQAESVVVSLVIDGKPFHLILRRGLFDPEVSPDP